MVDVPAQTLRSWEDRYAVIVPVLKRAVTVLKTRGSAHLQQMRRFEITPQGAVLGEPFDSRQSLD